MVNNASHFRSSAGPAEFNPLLRMNNSMGEMDFHPTRINECVKNIVATCSIVNCRKCKGARFASWIPDNIVIADCHILHCVPYRAQCRTFIFFQRFTSSSIHPFPCWPLSASSQPRIFHLPAVRSCSQCRFLLEYLYILASPPYPSRLSLYRGHTDRI